jgi:hypothetical protein
VSKGQQIQQHPSKSQVDSQIENIAGSTTVDTLIQQSVRTQQTAKVARNKFLDTLENAKSCLCGIEAEIEEAAVAYVEDSTLRGQDIQQRQATITDLEDVLRKKQVAIAQEKSLIQREILFKDIERRETLNRSP